MQHRRFLLPRLCLPARLAQRQFGMAQPCLSAPELLRQLLHLPGALLAALGRCLARLPGPGSCTLDRCMGLPLRAAAALRQAEADNRNLAVLLEPVTPDSGRRLLAAGPARHLGLARFRGTKLAESLTHARLGAVLSALGISVWLAQDRCDQWGHGLQVNELCVNLSCR